MVMKLAEVVSLFVGPDAADVEFTAYDGSRWGRQGSDVRLDVRSPRAVSYLMSSPGQLGLARAYVTGELQVYGDLYTALDRLARLGIHRPTVSDQARLYRALAPFALHRPPVPAEEVRLGGRVHTKRRDSDAISHHYDVSNTFYRWVLGPSMAYTCAVFPKTDATLEEAQEEKFDLVCRKLGLERGMRLLDVGCGWGGLAIHAAKNYGAKVIAVTLSEQQAAWGQESVRREGLDDLVQIRYQDYRDVPETGFDRISSIGLTEHIGYANYPAYFSFLRSRLNPQGRLLNHCITRTDTKQRTAYKSGFINRYIFPDGELVPVGKLVAPMEDAGWEVRHEENLREHYALTLMHWLRNLEEHWDEAVAEVGEGKARVWKLYLAASRLGFERNMIQLHQVLLANPDEHGHADIPLRLGFDTA
ncbi:MAG TPA: cyclopropane-fatty-acyl-phospholipid synthase family protein [Candidatus Nanopelagicales bacterium]|nr:cyclopropane-fatty-acyl-phospholipid synthase family protein [Candidatus Nanopelagicales bacterium]